MRIFLVDPYFTGSHRAWGEGYAAASRHDVHLITHEGRFWKWRMQGAALTLAKEVAASVAANGAPDVLMATSMTNLPALLGLARSSLGNPAVALYMHENQLTYPLSPRDLPDATYAMVNWLSMAASDLVLFNSDFHRSAWFGALPGFLKQFPDYVHDADAIAEVAGRSEVLPVGIDLRRLDGPSRRRRPPLVLWNQRCEYDKGPGAFVDVLIAVAARGIDFRIALAGERFVSEPSDFDRLRDRLGTRITHDGFAHDDAYVALLQEADIVISAAHQEFFGIAVTEAIYAGAFPLLPDRLVYPERLPPAFHAPCLYADEAELVVKLAAMLEAEDERRNTAAALRPHVASVDWAALAPRYDARLAELAQ